MSTYGYRFPVRESLEYSIQHITSGYVIQYILVDSGAHVTSPLLSPSPSPL